MSRAAEEIQVCFRRHAPHTIFTLQADTSILTLNEGGVGIFGRFSAFGMKNFGFSVLLSVVVSGFSLF